MEHAKFSVFEGSTFQSLMERVTAEDTDREEKRLHSEARFTLFGGWKFKCWLTRAEVVSRLGMKGGQFIGKPCKSTYS